MSQFEYREIIPTEKQVESYNQLDLYFFKPKAETVGVKARFNNIKPKQCWEIDELEFKIYIQNFEDIKSGKEVLQKWKKKKFTASFKVYTPHFIKSHPQTVLKGGNLQQAVKSNLRSISCQASQILKKAKLDQKHFKKNPELVKWLQSEYPIIEIFLIEKSRVKTSKGEKGTVRVSPLYGLQKYPAKSSKTFETTAFEADKGEKLLNILKDRSIKVQQNISYPKLLEKISCGQL